jgi:hypothetical protein
MLISSYSSFSYLKFPISFRTPRPFSQLSNPSQPYKCLAVTSVILPSPGDTAFPKDISPADSALACSPSAATSNYNLTHVSTVPSAFVYHTVLPSTFRPSLLVVRPSLNFSTFSNLLAHFRWLVSLHHSRVVHPLSLYFSTFFLR